MRMLPSSMKASSRNQNLFIIDPNVLCARSSELGGPAARLFSMLHVLVWREGMPARKWWAAVRQPPHSIKGEYTSGTCDRAHRDPYLTTSALPGAVPNVSN